MATFDASQAQRIAHAWEALAPEDDEVRYAVTRISVRLRRSARRSRRTRSVAAVCGIVLTGAALAYAAQAGVPWIERALLPRVIRVHSGGPSPARSSVLPAETAANARQPEGAGAPRGGAVDPIEEAKAPASVPSVRARRKPPHSVPSTDAATSAPPSTPTESAPTGAQGDAASWRLVDEALAERDDAQAKTLLFEIIRTTRDAHTRAAARLGLAQLYAGRGECAEARKIALAVAGEAGVPIAIARRAQRVLSLCFAR